MTMNNNCSSESIDNERSWVIDLEKKLASSNAAELSEKGTQWMKPSIFRLPNYVRMRNPDVFTPKVVAIGPYHHNKCHLQPLESHKERALCQFLKRQDKPLDVYVREMKSVVEELQDSYVDLDEEWKIQDNFIKLVITDGCFMLEVMRLGLEHYTHYYTPNDPFFGLHALHHKVPYMRRDMMILENQLPILVFKKLVSVEMSVNEQNAEYIITELIVNFFMPNIYKDRNIAVELQKTTQGFHALDIIRRCRLFHFTKAGHSLKIAQDPPINFTVMRSATRLHEAGITFKNNHSSALTTISFNRRLGILSLPTITVDNSTEHEFLNMAELEHLHSGCSSEISSYIAFMGSLVVSAEDVQLLYQYRLVNNRLGSAEDFARLFNSMSREVMIAQHGQILGSVQDAAEMYCQSRWNNWRANLVHTYFKNPWSFWSAVSTVVGIWLTAISVLIAYFQWRNI